jgi:toxin ParE1/3/4
MTAALWFDSQRVGLGDEFWRCVDEMLTQIESNPLRFSRSEFATPEFDLHFAIIPRFRYVIHFEVDAEEVQVVSVAHAARRPGYWLR